MLFRQPRFRPADLGPALAVVVVSAIGYLAAGWAAALPVLAAGLCLLLMEEQLRRARTSGAASLGVRPDEAEPTRVRTADIEVLITDVGEIDSSGAARQPLRGQRSYADRQFYYPWLREPNRAAADGETPRHLRPVRVMRVNSAEERHALSAEAPPYLEVVFLDPPPATVAIRPARPRPARTE
jgi:hypothetical protein